MRRFILHRNEDESGVSGIGDVADGVEFNDGQCVMSWRGDFHTVTVFPNLKAVVAIHGHKGKSVIKWIDPEEET